MKLTIDFAGKLHHYEYEPMKFERDYVIAYDVYPFDAEKSLDTLIAHYEFDQPVLADSAYNAARCRMTYELKQQYAAEKEKLASWNDGKAIKAETPLWSDAIKDGVR